MTLLALPAGLDPLRVSSYTESRPTQKEIVKDSPYAAALHTATQVWDRLVKIANGIDNSVHLMRVRDLTPVEVSGLLSYAKTLEEGVQSLSDIGVLDSKENTEASSKEEKDFHELTRKVLEKALAILKTIGDISDERPYSSSSPVIEDLHLLHAQCNAIREKINLSLAALSLTDIKLSGSAIASSSARAEAL